MSEQSPDALALQKQLHEVLHRHLQEHQQQSARAEHGTVAIYADGKAQAVRRVMLELGVKLE